MEDVKNNETANKETQQEEQVEKKQEAKIDFKKFDNAIKEEEKLTPEEKYQLEIEKLKAKAQEAEERALKIKQAFDKAASDRNALTKKVDEVKQSANQPLEKLREYEEKLKEYELNEKKTNLTLSLTDSLGVNKEMSDKIVGAIYHEDTNELSIGDLELALRELVNDVRKSAYQQGYETRETEFASGKPRSLGGQETADVFDNALARYKNRLER